MRALPGNILNNKAAKSIFVLLAFWVICQIGFAENSSIASASFKTWMSFPTGNGPGQLLCLQEENGGMLDGPFQGPMAFLTDKNSNLWVADTLNARILAFDKQGQQRKEIDLVKIGKKVSLASDPVALDIAAGTDGQLLIADAANNVVIAVDIRSESAKIYQAKNKTKWLQINRIHGDRFGRIYVEDIASMKTYVLNSDSSSFCEPLDGEVSLAVSADGKMAMVVNDPLIPERRKVVLAPIPGEPFVAIADLISDEPILWASTVDFDKQNKLNVVFDTPVSRNFVTLDVMGNIIAHRVTELIDPGYDAVRPEWSSANGDVFMVKAKSAKLDILKLE